MALTSDSTLQDALSQYKNNLRWWESPAKAADCHEAVMYLLGCRPEDITAADQSVDYASLEPLRRELQAFIVSTAATRHRASFVKGRVLG